jgi:hypothetical protein
MRGTPRRLPATIDLSRWGIRICAIARDQQIDEIARRLIVQAQRLQAVDIGSAARHRFRECFAHRLLRGDRVSEGSVCQNDRAAAGLANGSVASLRTGFRKPNIDAPAWFLGNTSRAHIVPPRVRADGAAGAARSDDVAHPSARWTATLSGEVIMLWMTCSLSKGRLSDARGVFAGASRKRAGTTRFR